MFGEFLGCCLKVREALRRVGGKTPELPPEDLNVQSRRRYRFRRHLHLHDLKRGRLRIGDITDQGFPSLRRLAQIRDNLLIESGVSDLAQALGERCHVTARRKFLQFGLSAGVRLPDRRSDDRAHLRGVSVAHLADWIAENMLDE